MNEPNYTQRRILVAASAVVVIATAVVLLVLNARGGRKENVGQAVPIEEQVATAAIQNELSRNEGRQGYRRNFASRKSGNRTQGRWEETEAKPIVNNTPYGQKTEREQLVFDLNTADTTDLQQLPGIGHTFSNRIVSYRNLLGGFVDKHQLLEVYNLTEEQYSRIEPYVVVGNAHVRQINLNEATLDQLKKHPYLSYYQAKAIVQYRNISRFDSVPDLLKVALIDQQTYNKVKPYLTVR